MRWIVGWAVVLGVGAVAVCEGAGPAARPYTVGAETTVVSGPVRADGTIDYVAVINGELSKGVTKGGAGGYWAYVAVGAADHPGGDGDR
ncbi:MAG TPA: hypothetical protein VHQ47_13135 [Phycisphaerae bacterium]|nr:hypothetical protein [Phycisphaerae bacterium]